MTAEIINLRQARKARERAQKEREAAHNREKFGRSKADRATAAATNALDNRALDGAKRTPATPGETAADVAKDKGLPAAGPEKDR